MLPEQSCVSAILPIPTMDQFLKWKNDRGFSTESQALLALVELFLSQEINQSPSIGSQVHRPDPAPIQTQVTHLQIAGECLESGLTELKKEIISHQPLVSAARIQELERDIAELREVIQMGRQIINDRLLALHSRIERLEGSPSLSPVNYDDLPDDEPDEILHDFLDPE